MAYAVFHRAMQGQKGEKRSVDYCNMYGNFLGLSGIFCKNAMFHYDKKTYPRNKTYVRIVDSRRKMKETNIPIYF